MAATNSWMASARIHKSILWRVSQTSLYKLTLLAILCTTCYLVGLWQQSYVDVSSLATNFEAIPCASEPRRLDFAPRHTARDPPHVAEGASRIIPACSPELSEYTPCHDAKRSLRFPRDRLIYRERHCPERKSSDVLKCRIPAPYGYRIPFRWPESRNRAWFSNVPHTELTVEKKGQNWVRYERDRFFFPGGGTMFPDGADAYIDAIGRLIDLEGGSIRTAVDTGCGVASWGAYLMSRNIVTMSFAPRDTHEAQVQFALERGVPALIGVMASFRLPYPARAFDMAHCSRCLIPWDQYDGIFMVEVDRILRPGGYWILSGPPINWQRHHRGWNRTVSDLKSEQTRIEKTARSLCWRKVVQKEDIAIWQKPKNHIHCKQNRRVFRRPPFCKNQDPDSAWYTKMETCITPLPQVSGLNLEELAGGSLERWPERLNAIPPRISSGNLTGIAPDDFVQDTQLWTKRVSYYKRIDNQLAQTGRYRNLLDMNAHFGGFAAALTHDPIWVMNIVPVEASPDTLGVIYERGLIGTYQTWCEAMSTYPRTYDFLHAHSVFKLYKDQCDIEDILLEMDRILRPSGGVIIRDDVDLLLKVKRVLDGMEWEGTIFDHEDGPLEREKILFANKRYWTAPGPDQALDNEGTRNAS